MPVWTKALASGWCASAARVPGAHLVVREDEVAAAALHADRQAELVARDHAALDVPAGSSRAELGVPVGSPRARHARAAGRAGRACRRGPGPPPRSADSTSIVSRSRRLSSPSATPRWGGSRRSRRRRPRSRRSARRRRTRLLQVPRRPRRCARPRRSPRRSRPAAGRGVPPCRGGTGRSATRRARASRRVPLGALEQRVVDVGGVLRVLDLEPRVPPGATERVERQVVAAWPRWVASYGVMPHT